MSTRAQIAFDCTRVLVYRHCDGYPDGTHGVLADLVPFVQSFMSHRGFDECYMPAQVIAAFVAKSKRDRERLCQSMLEAGDVARARYYREPDYLGFGVCTELHGDIEYLYLVRHNGTIEVHKVESQKQIQDGVLGFKSRAPMKVIPLERAEASAAQPR